MKKVSFLVLAALYGVAVLAQDGGGSANVDVNLKGNSGGGGYWMWIVGALVFVLLLIALLRGGGSSGRVVEKKTVVRD